jgi:formylmethanofuran dehydrogenase subunit B
MVEGCEKEVDQAVEEAAKILSGSHNPLIFGLDNSSLEAQVVGIELAGKLKGVIDDHSSLSYGKVTEHILNGSLPTCSLSEVDKADFFIYWGANTQHSHPRHLSEFTYYAHPGYSEVSTARHVGMGVVDVRESETASVASPFFKLSPGGDKDFMLSVAQGIERKPEGRDAQELFNLLCQSSFSVIFIGLGLVYSLKNDFSLLIEMINNLNLNIKVIPMTDKPNMRGFNQSLFDRTGYVNQVSFNNGISSGSHNSFWEQIKNQRADSILIVGADPFHSMPFLALEYLKKIPIISIDPFATSTTEASKIVLGSAVTGLEAGGTVLRMDGTKMPLSAIESFDKISDEQILKLLLEKVDR